MHKKSVFTRFKYISFLVFFLVILLILLMTGEKDIPTISAYPYGKNFAFTITADPDGSSLEETKIIYDFLSEIEVKTTLAVWVSNATRTTGLPDNETDRQHGDSCERPEYLRYVKKLQNKGFEIALHTVTAGNDKRKDTIRGYELFKEYFGSYPSINIMHSTNLENIYWGKKVVKNRLVKELISISADRSNIPFSGEDPKSEYYWGDLAKEKTKYVRLWGTTDINTLKLNPSMPYHDPQKPLVNYWFSFSDGWTVEIFNDLITETNINRLAAERGACIVYTHFARNFVKNGKLNTIFKERMKKIAKRKDGWFVPATNLLDRLLLMKKVKIEDFAKGFAVVNLNDQPVTGVTVNLSDENDIYDTNNNRIKPNNEAEIIIEKLMPAETRTYFRNKSYFNSERKFPTALEKMKMFFNRVFVYLSHN